MNLTEQFWEKIYKNNFSKMVGVCYSYVQNKDIASDLAQDAFLTAINKSGSFKGLGSFEAWLRRIAVNSALQYLRKQNKEKHYELYLQPQEIMEALDDQTDKPLVEKFDFSTEELLELVNNLPEHHRLVFNMYVIDNCSHKEIATELGISQGTSKCHLARARKQIQKQISDKEGQKNLKRSILLLLCPQLFINRIYKKAFSNFEIHSFNVLKDVNWNCVIKPNLSNVVFSLNSFLYFGIIVGLITSATLIYKNTDSAKNLLPLKPDTNIVVDKGVKTETNKSAEKVSVLPEITKDSTKTINKTVVIKKQIIKHKAIYINKKEMTNDSTEVQ